MVFFETGERQFELIFPEEGVFFAGDKVCQELFDGTVAVEVLYIAVKGTVLACGQFGVEAPVTGEDIGAAVAVDIGEGDRLPETFGAGGWGLLQRTVMVGEDLYIHPFAGDDEVHLSIAVEVGEGGGGGDAFFGEEEGLFEVGVAIIDQE